jgi:hypothetical protein
MITNTSDKNTSEGKSCKMIGIKRNSEDSLDSLFGYTADDVEHKREVQATLNLKLQEIFEHYKDHVSFPRASFTKAEIPFILTPEEINTLIQMTLGHLDIQEHQNYTGCYLSRLIQNSYDNGENNFVFEDVYEISKFGHCLRGKKSNPITLNVLGGLADYSFQNLSHVNVKVNGNVGNLFGEYSINLTALIFGDVLDNCLYGGDNSTIFVDGNVESGFVFLCRNSFAAITKSCATEFSSMNKDLTIFVEDKSKVMIKKGYDSSIIEGNLSLGGEIYQNIIGDIFEVFEK